MCVYGHVCIYIYEIIYIFFFVAISALGYGYQVLTNCICTCPKSLRSMPRVTIKHYGAVIHCSPNQLRTVLDQLGLAAPVANCPSALDVLEHSATATQTMQAAILKAFPSIDGHATGSFGVTIRVPQVRSFFASHAIRGVPLLKIMGCISSAADAKRHLSPTIIEEALHLMGQLSSRQHTDSMPVPPPINYSGLYDYSDSSCAGMDIGFSDAALSQDSDLLVTHDADTKSIGDDRLPILLSQIEFLEVKRQLLIDSMTTENNPKPDSSDTGVQTCDKDGVDSTISTQTIDVSDATVIIRRLEGILNSKSGLADKECEADGLILECTTSLDNGEGLMDPLFHPQLVLSKLQDMLPGCMQSAYDMAHEARALLQGSVNILSA